MRVVLVSPYSWTIPGGVNVHVAALAKHLRARGHEVRVIAPADGPVEPGVSALGRTLPVPWNGSVARLTFGPRVASRIKIALRRTRPDVVHIHEPFSPSASLLALRAAKMPVVATFHASIDSRIYRIAGIPLRRLWRKLAARIAVSKAACMSVERIFGPGVRIIPNGVETSTYAAVPDADGSGSTILYFGRLESRKGPQVLVEAIPALRERVPDARIVIAGDGPLRRRLEEAVPAAHRDAVTFTGRFPDDDRLRLLADAAVVCLPAIGGESFGIVLVEAMAAGRPIVASAIPGFAAVARAGLDAVLVPSGDARALADGVAGLLADPAKATALGRSAREAASRFDWDHVTTEIEAVYREAIAP